LAGEGFFESRKKAKKGGKTRKEARAKAKGWIPDKSFYGE